MSETRRRDSKLELIGTARTWLASRKRRIAEEQLESRSSSSKSLRLLTEKVDSSSKLGLIKPLEPHSRCQWKVNLSGGDVKCPNVVAGKDGVIRPEGPNERSRRNLFPVKKNVKSNEEEVRNNPSRPDRKGTPSVAVNRRPRSSLEDGVDADSSSGTIYSAVDCKSGPLKSEWSRNNDSLLKASSSLDKADSLKEPMVALGAIDNATSSDLPVSTKCQTGEPLLSENFMKWKEHLVPEGMDPQKFALDLQHALAPDEDGDRALHIAVVHQDVLLVRQLAFLIRSFGVSVDLYNHMRQTPLHLAVILKDPHLCEALLEEGALSQARDRHGNTSLHLAVEHNTNECLLVLLRSKGAQEILNARNYEGLSCLHLTILKKNMLAAYYLVKAGCDIDVQEGKNGRTPLMNAVFARRIDMVKILLRLGATVTARDYAGNSALSAANELDLRDLVTLLEAKAALTNET